MPEARYLRTSPELEAKAPNWAEISKLQIFVSCNRIKKAKRDNVWLGNGTMASSAECVWLLSMLASPSTGSKFLNIRNLTNCPHANVNRQQILQTNR